MAKRVLVIGLDCAAPQFVFDRLLPELPTIRSLTERGSFGVLRSCDPSITVPAWSVMTSSRSPRSLGFYGFRDRRDHSYELLDEPAPEEMEARSMLRPAAGDGPESSASRDETAADTRTLSRYARKWVEVRGGPSRAPQTAAE